MDLSLLAKCCEYLMDLSKEARKGTLGAMHPSFNMLKKTRDFLTRELPSNAHLLASGRLCVSLTRVSDGENVLVSEYASKNDLIQVNTPQPQALGGKLECIRLITPVKSLCKPFYYLKTKCIYTYFA